MRRRGVAGRSVVMAGLLVALGARAGAQDLVGASEAIRRIGEGDGGGAADVVATIRGLMREPEAADPAASASAWLDAFDRWKALPIDVRYSVPDLASKRLIDALPGPASWIPLSDLIDARPIPDDGPSAATAVALRMLGHRLAGRTDELKKDVERARKIAAAPSKPPRNGGLIEAIAGIFQDRSNDDFRMTELRDLAKGMDERLSHLAVGERFERRLADFDPREAYYLEVPNLVRAMGEEAAEPLLLKAIRTQAPLSFEHDDHETIRAARVLALAHVRELPYPRWDLCRSLDTTALYEALAARSFAVNSQIDRERDWYIAGLIAANRPEDVLRAWDEKDAEEGPADYYMIDWQSFRKAGRSAEPFECLSKLLAMRPNLPLWDLYEKASQSLGKEPQAIAAMDRALAGDGLSAERRVRLREIRVSLTLAIDRLEDAVLETSKLLAESAKEGPPDEGEDEDEQARKSRDDLRRTTAFQAAVRIADVGRLTGRDEWIRLGTDAAETILREAPDVCDGADLANLLIEVGRLADAERVLIDWLKEQADLRRRFSDPDVDQMEPTWDSLDSSGLAALMAVYDRGGRWADVVDLLEGAPWWDEPDLAAYLKYAPSSADRGVGPAPYTPLLAARALAKLGRNDEARRIVAAVVRAWPGCDAGWELALEILGDDFAPLARQAAAADVFEERPLIWLATDRLNRGDLDEAERLVRKAIAVDPSDGEQGPGDRLRAYAVLARILEKRGDARTAADYDKAVAAIRLSERADAHRRVGLTARAVRMYRESLEMFADAYCIQSRLAVQLALTGDADGAAEHYQRAFELMPDSFGRIESHCFGCEMVFDGPLAEAVAERVFLKLAADRPADPRVQYLLGYLRQSQSREAEALVAFREATRLDSDYFNAWKAILNLDPENVPAEDREAAAMALIRLDPRRRRSWTASGTPEAAIKDLGRLWEVDRESRSHFRSTASGPVFELKAARRRLAELDVDRVEMDDEDDVARFSTQPDLNAIAGFLQSVD